MRCVILMKISYDEDTGGKRDPVALFYSFSVALLIISLVRVISRVFFHLSLFLEQVNSEHDEGAYN